jgi:Putative collagen-binding domain of a collagenase
MAPSALDPDDADGDDVLSEPTLRRGGSMLRFVLTLGCLLIVACVGSPTGLGGPARFAPATGPLRVHPTNPRYFTDGSGKAIYLTGSHTWTSLVNRGLTDPPAELDYSAYLDFLERYNHNFIRLWTHELFWEPDGYGEPLPWLWTGPGNAHDGKPKFDLSKFNQSFFDRLRSRVIAARDRGIYVGVMFFKAENAALSADGHPFGPNSNINGINGDPDGDGRIGEIYNFGVPGVLDLQKAYIEKVIDTVNDLDNVLYEIVNEAEPTSVDWQYHLINFVKNYTQHPVGMTAISDNDNAPLFSVSNPADWISPGRDSYGDDPPAADGRKVIILDTDHIGPVQPSWVWKSFLRGLHPILMDWYDKSAVGYYTVDEGKALRKYMGYTLFYADRMNLAAMVPRNDLASTTYCLADPGREYLVYHPNGGGFSVDLVAGSYDYEWFNPQAGSVEGQGTLSAGAGAQYFSPPFGGEAVLYLKLEGRQS